MNKETYKNLCSRIAVQMRRDSLSRESALYAINQFVLNAVEMVGIDNAIRAGSFDEEGKFVEGQFVEVLPFKYDFVLLVLVGEDEFTETFDIGMQVTVIDESVGFFCVTTQKASSVPFKARSMVSHETASAVSMLLAEAVRDKVDAYLLEH